MPPHGAPVFDDASLARALVVQLQSAGAVTNAHLGDAARHFAAGRLPGTALALAGVARPHLLDALAAVTGLPRAPDVAAWTPAVRGRAGLDDDAWRRARAVPFGVRDDRMLVAFADVKLIATARASLPPHEAFVCLEDDIDAALAVAPARDPAPPQRTEAFVRATDAAEGFAVQPAAQPTVAFARGGDATEGFAVQDAVPGPPRGDATVQIARAAQRFGPFVVDALLARGGMGTVYDAHDEEGRRAAVKAIHPHLLHLAEVRARFVREAQSTQRLQHENIVRVLGVGTEPAWLAVEFLEGGTVTALLEKHERLPLVVALELFAELIAGLEAAHAQGIVHRDLKPDNLLLSRDGVLKIADFGIARELDATAMTQTGSTLGTPAYMSPEQARAEPVDPRSDLYTAGVILYELLTGKNPFRAESLGAIIANILRGNAAPLFEVDPSIPDGIEALVSSLMHRDREQRPASAAAVLAGLRPIVDDLRRTHPHVVRELMQRPAVAKELVRAQADALVGAARVLLQGGVTQREPAALLLFRAQVLVPEHAEAKALLAGLAPEGIAFGKPSAKLAALEREVAAKPDDPVLLQRTAQLARQEGNLYTAAIYFRRYLRVRPEDQYVRAQAERLTVVVATPGVLDDGGTMQRIAGHLATGGFAASPPMAPPSGATLRLDLARAAEEKAIGPGGGGPGGGAPGGGAPQDSAASAVAASWSVHKTKLIAAAVALALVVGGVQLVRRLITGAQRSIDDSSFGVGPTKPKNAGADDVDLAAARAAFAAGQWTDVERHASAVIERGGGAFVMSESLLLRGKSLLAQNRAVAAIEDLTRVVTRYGGEQQAFREALLRRGTAYVAAGEKAKAKDDFTRALAESLPQNMKALAHLERGLILLEAGDVAAARADLEKAESYTPPNDDTHVRALAALARVP